MSCNESAEHDDAPSPPRSMRAHDVRPSGQADAPTEVPLDPLATPLTQESTTVAGTR